MKNMESEVKNFIESVMNSLANANESISKLDDIEGLSHEAHAHSEWEKLREALSKSQKEAAHLAERCDWLMDNYSHLLNKDDCMPTIINEILCDVAKKEDISSVINGETIVIRNKSVSLASIIDAYPNVFCYKHKDIINWYDNEGFSRFSYYFFELL